MDRHFSDQVNKILILSKEEADRLQNAAIAPEHLMLGILRHGHNRAIECLAGLNVDLSDLKQRLENHLGAAEVAGSANSTFDNIVMTDAASKILRIGMLEARMLKTVSVEAEHLLLAILRDETNQTTVMLSEQQIDYRKMLDQVKFGSESQPTQSMGMGFDQDEEDDETPSQGTSGKKSDASAQTATRTASGSKTPVLDNFSMDLTRRAEEGKLDPVVGRQQEIERLAQILTRRKKNNPILIGEPGVGKTAIVEGLAMRIITKQVPRILFGKRVLSLDMASVVAGTKYRGQFEERIRSIINELRNNPDIILYIDEIHTIVGAGSAPGSMDAANMLKPALSRGELQCIGSTTIEEYRKTIEKDGALERRFQKILVEQTTPEETLQILHNIKDRYEEHHNVTYSDDALIACVKYARRYLTDRNFPDKAIDVMDEAGSRTHLFNMNAPKQIEDQEAMIDSVKLQKTDAVKRQDFEAAASLRDKEKQLEVQLAEMRQEWEKSLREQRETVSEEQIAGVVSMMSGVPVQKIAKEEGARLKGLATVLKSKVIAQDPAIDTLVKAIRRGRVGIKNPDKPIGSFLFLGPTGVGKTLLAKELAVQMFGSKDALIRVDMSEFMEKFSVSRLVGAPPGYVGYDEGGELTEKVRRKPYSIILLDEIEKAHADVYNILLQVMDDGRLTDSNGRTVDFRNTVIIMTSNIGSRQIKDFGRGMGFTSGSDTRNMLAQEITRKALNKSFAPEFLNRIDEIISFEQLDRKSVRTIVDLELEELAERIGQLGYSVSFTEAARDFLADKGFDPEFGARPLKRVIQSFVEDRLAEMLIEEECHVGDNLELDYTQDAKELTVTIK